MFKTIAVALGYDPSGGDGWPSWIDELAAEIEALPRPREIRLADPTKHEDGFGAASHDYHVVFGRRSPWFCNTRESVESCITCVRVRARVFRNVPSAVLPISRFGARPPDGK